MLSVPMHFISTVLGRKHKISKKRMVKRMQLGNENKMESCFLQLKGLKIITFK